MDHAVSGTGHVGEQSEPTTSKAACTDPTKVGEGQPRLLNPQNFKLDSITALFLLLLAMAIAAAFAPLTRAGFIELDDRTGVFANPYVMGGLRPRNVAWAITTRAEGLWMPLTRMSFQLDATLSKLVYPEFRGAPDARDPLPPATIFHLDNLLQHWLGTCLIFLFLYRATGCRWPSFAVALLWAVHPLRVESVAWVVERKDTLSGLFGFLAIYAYIVWAENRSRAWYAAVFLAMAASLMSKPTFVTLPFVLLLVDFWPLGRLTRLRDLPGLLLEKWPLFLQSALRSLATVWITRNTGRMPLGFSATSNAIVSYGRYLWMHVNLDSLGIFYPFTAPGILALCGTIVLLLAISTLCLMQRKNRPWLLAGWLWYLGAFVPMIGFYHICSQGYADRFTYFPAIGLLIMLVFSVPLPWWESPRRLVIVLPVATIVAATLIFFTMRQSGYWHDSIALGLHSQKVARDNSMVHRILGGGYMQESQFDKAVLEYKRVIELDGPTAEGYTDLGSAYLTMGHTKAAIEQCTLAIQVDQYSSMGHAQLGAALAIDQQYDAAIEHLERCLVLDPFNDIARGNLAEARKKKNLRDGVAP